MGKRTVLITGSMTANASTLISNITDFEPLVKNYFLNQGWDIVSVKLVGSWFSYDVTVSIEANVFDNYSLADVKQNATSVLSNIYYIDSLIFDPRYPIFTNVYVTAIEANRNQIDDAFKYNNSIDEFGNKVANVADQKTAEYLLPVVMVGIAVLLITRGRR